MPLIRQILLVFSLLIALAPGPGAASDTDRVALTGMLHEFLAGASRGDVAAHERFWADELVYTSSDGSRTDKQSIINSMRAASDQRPATPPIVYSADEIRVDLYDSTAIVAFRLVATPNDGEPGAVRYYLNTGTFLKRDGEWRAVAWQATRAPDS